MKQSKKILSIITASALAISCTVGASAVQTEELSSSALTKTVYGDVNHDGYVSLADAIKLMQHAIGQSKISNDNLTAAEMSSNIQLKDALEVMKIASNGKIVRVNGVKLGASSKTVNVGESFSLGASVTPSNAANKNLAYSSSNSSVAVVDANGKVTAKGVGKATITATTVDGGYKASCSLTVSVVKPSITQSSVSLDIGQTQSVSYMSKSAAPFDNYTVKTSNSAVVSASRYGSTVKLKALKSGSATVTVTEVNTGAKDSVKVTVKAAETSNTITVSGVKYNTCDNYSSKYLYDQTDYSKFVSGGSNAGCSATAEAIGASMYYGRTITPDSSEIGWIYGVGATFWLADVRYSNMSVDSKLTIAYNQLKKGNPSIINTLNYSDHWVTIIGIKSTANPNALKTSDFLIANPWGGTLSNLETYLSSTGRYIPYSYSMRTYE